MLSMISAASQHTKLIETRKRYSSWMPILFLENPQESTCSRMSEPSLDKSAHRKVSFCLIPASGYILIRPFFQAQSGLDRLLDLWN